MKKNLDLFGNVIITDPILRERFIEPPFSVLDTKCGSWQNRKKQWKQLGIESHLGRKNEDTGMKKSISDEEWEKKYGRKVQPFVSIFDPALCELIYNWYCPDNGKILDPFAGGSVRGIVANKLGYNYTGIDIRQEQIDSNREQCLKLLPLNKQPNYYVGDSNLVIPNLITEYDLIFSCPPYADLEVYSDLENDLSNMEYDNFLDMYSEIIKKSVQKLKKGSYACFVVGDIRDKKGFYRDFISHTKKAFINAGAGLYNEAILLQPLGTAMLRAGKIFEAGKKLTKVHENVLIFKKY
jgi:DNA modification methylase